MSRDQTTVFDWTEELHKEVVKSLATTFGLDFLLFDDKKGGDVDTIHNARQYQKYDKDINMSDSFKSDYDNREKYKSERYHADSSYINQGKSDKIKQANEDLNDPYRNKKMTAAENRQLDHTISAKEIDDDAGRMLAGADGVKLANQQTNLNSTHSYINNLKSDKTIDEFLDVVVPQTISNKNERIAKNQEKIKSMPNDTPQQRHELQKIKDQVRKDQEHIDTIKSIDKEGMRKADKKARDKYNSKINYEYYTSSRFLMNTASVSMHSGFKMGARQSIGIVLAEVWFELKESIPITIKKLKSNFTLDAFFVELKVTVENIFSRVSNKFKDIIDSFKDGFLSGILSSITTTVLNVFLTTQRLIGRLIRETWNSLVGALKLIFFNPNKLTAGQLAKEVIRILSAGAAAFIGIVINQQLAQFFTFPFGTEIAAFLSALVTGIIIVGLTYFLDHSPMMKKIWDFLDKFKSKIKITLENFQRINTELDRYLLELSKIEFNLNPQEIEEFSDSLLLVNDEIRRNIILTEEVNRRNIELPFEMGNTKSTRAWLTSLQSK